MARAVGIAPVIYPGRCPRNVATRLGSARRECEGPWPPARPWSSQINHVRLIELRPFSQRTKVLIIDVEAARLDARPNACSRFILLTVAT